MTEEVPKIPSRLIVVGCDDIVGPWVCSRTGGEWSEGMTTIGLAKNNVLIAGVCYDSFNGVAINMHVASDGSKRWLDRGFLYTCFDYPFNQLGCKRINGLVSKANVAAQRFDESLGFELEASLKDAHPEGDLLIYRMFRKDCRWLNLRKGVKNGW